MLAGASASVHSFARVEYRRARAALHPLLRPDTARRDRGRCRDHRDSLDAPGRGLGSHLPPRRVGRGGWHHRREALPRRHELGRASGRVVGGLRDLEGRARGLGRDRARGDRGRDRRQALRSGCPEAHGLRRPRAARRARHRALWELVEPGALRRPDRPSLGSRDLSRQPADRGRGAETFHPTFLYEALWSFAAAGVLLLVERRFRLRPGNLFALYVLLYSIGRVWIETLRVDPSHELGGVRLNVYVAALAIVVSAAFFVFWQRTWKRGTGPPLARWRRWPSRETASPGTFSPPAVYLPQTTKGGVMRYLFVLSALVVALTAVGGHERRWLGDRRVRAASGRKRQPERPGAEDHRPPARPDAGRWLTPVVTISGGERMETFAATETSEVGVYEARSSSRRRR